jgi:hypothetical protein
MCGIFICQKNLYVEMLYVSYIYKMEYDGGNNKVRWDQKQ